MKGLIEKVAEFEDGEDTIEVFEVSFPWKIAVQIYCDALESSKANVRVKKEARQELVRLATVVDAMNEKARLGKEGVQ